MRPHLSSLCVCMEVVGFGLREGGISIAPKGQERITTENSSLSRQCHTNPLEIALSMGLFRMRFYSKF